MSKTRRPVIAGIFILICAALGLLGAFAYGVGLGEPGSGFGRGDMPPFVPSIIFGVPIMSVITSALAIAGGISALVRKKWAWALAGSIAAALSFVLLGIPAIVLVSLSRGEFNSRQ